MTHYVVEGDPVFVANWLLGSNYGNPAWSSVVFLGPQYSPLDIFGNHGMDAVVASMREYLKPKPTPTPTPQYSHPWVPPGAPMPGAIVTW